MAALPTAMKDKHMSSEFIREVEAFQRRKGRLPTMAEMDNDPKMRKGLDKIAADFTGGGPDPNKGYGYSGYSHASVAPHPGCTEKCNICKSQWLVGLPTEVTGYDACFTDLEARDQIDTLLCKIRREHTYIRDRIEAYGDVVAKRWAKRMPTKRATLLKKALPDIYPKRGFPLTEWINLRPGQMNESTEEQMVRLRTAELLPYLNLEALSESSLDILALLSHRALYAPFNWVTFDLYQHEYNFSSGFVRSSYNPHCVSMSRESFGQLVSFKKQALHNGTTISFPQAKLLLEAQASLYSFLHVLTDLILGSEIQGVDCTGRAELDRLSSGRLSDRPGWTTDRLTPNSAFSAPATFDIGTLVDHFKLRLQAAEDELEILQTDPSYLREQLMRAEGSAALSGTSSEKRLSELAELLVVSLQKRDNWSYVVSETESAAKVLQNRAQTRSGRRNLPDDYDLALSVFEQALRTQFKEQQDHLTTMLLASKNFNRFFIKRGDGQFVVNEQLRKMNQTDSFLYNLIELTRYDEINIGFHASSLFRYLDDILSHTTRQNAGRLDRAMYMVISDMVVIDRALTAVKLHRPRCSGFGTTMRALGITDEDSVFELILGTSQPSGSLLSAFMQRTTMEGFSEKSYTEAHDDGYKQLRASLAAFLDTPVPTGRANQTTVDVLTRSHDAIKALWSEIRKWRKGSMVQLGLKASEADKRVRCLSYAGSTKHEKLIESERQSLLTAIEAREQVASARQGEAAKKAKQMSMLQTVWGTAEANDTSLSVLKTKEKTKSTAKTDHKDSDRPGTTAEDLLAATESLALTPQVEVSKESVRLLSRMYTSLDDTKANKGSVKWDDLVAALIDSGFQVTPNGGSAVTFRSTNGQGSIVFHRPHPDPNLNSIMLRSMGKRLAKWFGWEKDTFVERGKV